MTRWFSSLSLRTKLHSIVLVSCALALSLATTSAFLLQHHYIHTQLQAEIRTLADVISQNSRAGLAFLDQKALTTILPSLSAKPRVVAARIYTDSGTLIAE